MWITPEGTRLELPNHAEQLWIEEELSNSIRFVTRFSGIQSEQLPTLSDLDSAWAEFCAEVSPVDGEKINAAINAVGIAFGQSLVNSLGLQWVAATDEAGCEIAVVGLPGKANFIVYPANFVAKRWERRETGFLVGAQEFIAGQYARFRAGYAAS